MCAEKAASLWKGLNFSPSNSDPSIHRHLLVSPCGWPSLRVAGGGDRITTIAWMAGHGLHSVTQRDVCDCPEGDEKRQLFLFTNHLQCSLATFVYIEVGCTGYAGCQGVGAVAGSALGRAPRHADQTRPKRLAGVKLEKYNPQYSGFMGYHR